MTIKFKLDPSASVPIPCPKCGKQTQQLISRLRTNPKLRCGACRAEFTVDGKDLDRAMKLLGSLGH
jgi:uncharacterized Zn finger protein